MQNEGKPNFKTYSAIMVQTINWDMGQDQGQGWKLVAEKLSVTAQRQWDL